MCVTCSDQVGPCMPSPWSDACIATQRVCSSVHIQPLLVTLQPRGSNSLPDIEPNVLESEQNRSIWQSWDEGSRRHGLCSQHGICHAVVRPVSSSQTQRCLPTVSATAGAEHIGFCLQHQVGHSFHDGTCRPVFTLPSCAFQSPCQHCAMEHSSVH